ncbi:hypothetical protein [Sunxiuqinia indica]|uniref:hypothetical protein n=1 Tax=Sunxiuqinia indica TaxID=2692584 RepID=UPI00135A75CB|nr:hypothetical protein [Sunxiuqinia indica]
MKTKQYEYFLIKTKTRQQPKRCWLPVTGMGKTKRSLQLPNAEAVQIAETSSSFNNEGEDSSTITPSTKKNKNMKFNKLTLKSCSILLVALGFVLFFSTLQSCSDEYLPIEDTLTKTEYEQMLKEKVASTIYKQEEMKTSFAVTQGIPLWNKLYWSENGNTKMVIVPMVSASGSKKHLVGVVQNNNIKVLVTELSGNDNATFKVYSTNHQLLYDSKNPSVGLRLKSGTIEQFEDILSNGGSAEDLYNSVWGEGSTYNEDEPLGTMRICTNEVAGSSAGTDIGGHAWIEIQIGDDVVSFSLWNGEEGNEYHVNYEQNNGYSAAASMETELSWCGLQTILDYNSDPDNTDWSATNTCAGYSTDIWNAVTGQDLDFGIVTTPAELYEYMNGD